MDEKFLKKEKPELITKTIHITIEESIYLEKVQPIEIERWVSIRD